MYGLDVFDAQCAEQDDGVLECNRSARRVLLRVRGSLRCNAGTSKCCFDVYKLLMSNDIDRPPASWSIYTVVTRNNELAILECEASVGHWRSEDGQSMGTFNARVPLDLARTH